MKPLNPIKESEWNLLKDLKIINEDLEFVQEGKVEIDDPLFDIIRFIRKPKGREALLEKAIQVYKEGGNVVQEREESSVSETDNESDTPSISEEGATGPSPLHSDSASREFSTPTLNVPEDDSTMDEIVKFFNGLSKDQQESFKKQIGADQQHSELDELESLIKEAKKSGDTSTVYRKLSTLGGLTVADRIRICNQKLAKFSRTDDAETWIARNERFMEDFESMGERKWQYELPALLDAFSESYIAGWAESTLRERDMNWNKFKEMLIEAFPRSDKVREGIRFLEKSFLREDNDDVVAWLGSYEGALNNLQSTKSSWSNSALSVFVLAKSTYPKMQDKLLKELEKKKGDWNFREAANMVKWEHDHLRRRVRSDPPRYQHKYLTDRAMSKPDQGYNKDSYNRSPSPRREPYGSSGRSQSPAAYQAKTVSFEERECYQCHKKGHTRRFCPENDRSNSTKSDVYSSKNNVVIQYNDEIFEEFAKENNRRILKNEDNNKVMQLCEDNEDVMQLCEDRIMVTHEELQEYINVDEIIEDYCPARVKIVNPEVERRPYADVRLDGVSFSALTDLGSERIVICEDHLDQINLQRKLKGLPLKPMKESEERLSGLYNQFGKEREKCSIFLVSFGSFESYERVTVIKSPCDVILSAQFLEAALATVDWTERTMVPGRSGLFKSKELTVQNGIPEIKTPKAIRRRSNFGKQLQTLAPMAPKEISSLRPCDIKPKRIEGN